jgi:acyl-CoA synthetase (AMP-forming)/AMP-acid ligase II
MPHSHAASLSVLMLSLTRGARLTIQTDKRPHAVLSGIVTIRADAVAAFPKTFVDLCRMDLDAYDLESVQYWIATGDANHEPHIRKLIAHGHHVKDGEKRPGSRFVDNLGSSEFGFAIFRNVHGPDSDAYDRNIGTPFPWVEVAVLADDGSQVPANTVGKLGVISRSVTKGYWNNHNLTEQNRLRGYWLTGDLVYRDENGAYFHLDRTSDYIETLSGVLYSCWAEELFLKHLPDPRLMIHETAGTADMRQVRRASDGGIKPLCIPDDGVRSVQVNPDLDEIIRCLIQDLFDRVFLQIPDMHLVDLFKGQAATGDQMFIRINRQHLQNRRAAARLVALGFLQIFLGIRQPAFPFKRHPGG